MNPIKKKLAPSHFLKDTQEQHELCAYCDQYMIDLLNLNSHRENTNDLQALPIERRKARKVFKKVFLKDPKLPDRIKNKTLSPFPAYISFLRYCLLMNYV